MRLGFAVLALCCALVSAAGADIRLDSRVAPVFEAVELDLDANRTDYSGTVQIELEVRENTDAFEFHAEEMTLDSIKLVGADGDPVAVEVEEGDEGLRHVTCGRSLEKGEKLQLEIAFSKDYNTQALGLYRIEHEGQGYLFTQFEAVDARKAFPCWDEPIFKIPFQVTVTIPMQQEAVSNTPIERLVMGAATKTLHFKRTPPLPSYLIAIAAGPLESVAIPGLSVPGRIYTVKGQKHLTGLAAEYAPPALAALEEYFGRPYPFEKLDLIAIPEYWPGAMENPGAVTYKDRILLIDPEVASIEQKRYLARVHAHEFAHMWFGDLVTMEWWDDLWLNESFADWMGDKIADGLYPELKLAVSELQNVQQLMTNDARLSTPPVRNPIESTADMMDNVLLAYGKGKTVLRMVEVWIGEDAFQEGVRNYLNRHEWGNTVADDLFLALSQASEMDLSPMLASFLEQSGLPLVTVTSTSDGVIKLRQERYLNAGVEAEPRQWVIPVRVKFSDGSTTQTRTALMDKPEIQLEVGGNVKWAMPNQGAYGYYRWSAPPEMLFEIASDPKENLDERERAVFLGNAHALLDAGEIGGDEYLTLLGTFARYPEPEIVNAVLDGLGGVSIAFITDDMRDAFGHYVRETLEPAYERYGMTPKDGEPEAATLVRPRLIRWLGGSGQHPEVRKACVELARAYEEDPTSIDASLAGPAIRIAAIEGSAEDFDHYLELGLKADVPADRARYLRALGHFEDPALQERVLGLIADGRLRPDEIFPVVQGVARTEAGRDRLFKWMTENYDRIAERIPAMMMSYMPYFASGCSQKRLAAAEAFFSEPGHDISGTAKSLENVTEQVGDCVALRDREGAAVADYLSKLASR
jgi:alanyl aminopeptidase